MTTAGVNSAGKSAAEFDRPLLLTASQDIRGYIFGKAGSMMLFLTAATSVLAILLIFIFVFFKSWHFAQTSGGDAQYDQWQTSIRVKADEAYKNVLLQTGDRKKAEAASKETEAQTGSPERAKQQYEDVLEATGDLEMARRQKAAILSQLDLPFGTQLSNAWSRTGEILTCRDWSPTHGFDAKFGGWTLLFGSLLVTVGALLVAVPLGLFAAIVLSDIVPFKVRQVVKPIVEILASIPSVAFGFFAIMVVAPWMQKTFGWSSGANALNASMLLAVMAIPTIVSVSEDAITAVGRELREASYAVGATRFETVFKVIIPAAHSGIIAAVILGMMRAIGETMVVLMATGMAAQIPTPWWDLSQSVRTMTATIAQEMGETSADSIHRSALFAVGIVLLIMTFILNLVTEYFVSRFKTSMGHSGATKSGLLARLANRIGGRVKRILKIAAFVPLCTMLIAAWSYICFVAGAGFIWFFAVLIPAGLWLGLKHLNSRVEKYIAPLRMPIRLFADKAFTSGALMSVLLLVAVLAIVLGPMLYKAIPAVFFQGTVEFRRLEMEMFNRGDGPATYQEIQDAAKARKPVYDAIRSLEWLDPKEKVNQTGKLLRSLKDQMANRNHDLKIRLSDLERQLAGAEPSSPQIESLKKSRKILAWQTVLASEDGQILKEATRLCRKLRQGYESDDIEEAKRLMKSVAEFDGKDFVKESGAETFFDSYKSMAREYLDLLSSADLSYRKKYCKLAPELTYMNAYKGVCDIVNERLLGLENRQNISHLSAEFRYGATRGDMAKKYLNDLLVAEIWLPQGPGTPNKAVKISRANLFDGPGMGQFHDMFAYAGDNFDAMMLPKTTFYWQFFIDDATPGHFLGGIGPEIVGTLMITLCAILFALPLGVITAGYLVECADSGDTNKAVRAIRMCINTLAGVPSIVFGLFGLACFVLLMPGNKPCILSAALTLAMLILPVIIRASEEAIQAVPRSYREASMGLGAGKLRCFLTVTLPASLPGILTGTILAMSRAAGETAPILFTGAVAYRAGFAWGLFDNTRTLSYSGFDLAMNDKLAKMVPHNQYGTVATLILLVLLLNITAIIIRSRISRKLQGH